MNEDLNGLEFSFDNLPPELLNNPDNDIFRGFGEHDLDLDSLLNSSLIEENGGEQEIVASQTLQETVDQKPDPQTIISNVNMVVGGVEVKPEPDIALNQSPVLESLLKCSAVATQCVNPAPQANTSFAPTVTARNQPVATTLNEALPPADNEALLAALLKRHEEDRKILDHLVTDIQRKSGRESNVIPKTLKHPSVVQLPARTVEQAAPMPAQVVVATPVNTRPVGIISGTRMFVTKPAAPTPMSAPEIIEDMDIVDDDITVDEEEPYRPKTKRRSSHNAIEKRYRLSINMRIDEMRTLIDGADSKLSKSAVLRRAIERIRTIERENYLLRKELAAAGITPRCISSRTSWADMKNDFNSVDDNVSSPESLPVSSTSPGSSMGGSPPHSPPEQLPNAGSRAPRLAHLLRKPEPQGTALLAALGNRTRVCLAAAFLGLFLINPLALWDLGSGGQRFVSPGGAVAHGGRTILGYWEKESNERRNYIWLFVMAIALFILTFVWLLRRSRKWQNEVQVSENNDMDFVVWRHWAQAESCIAETSWRRAACELKRVLIALGNPLPIGRWDCVHFLVRHLTVSLGLKPLLSAQFKASTADLNCRAMSKLLALAQHGHVVLSGPQRTVLTFALAVSIRFSQQLSPNDKCRALINLSLAVPFLRSRLRRKAADALLEPSGSSNTLGWLLSPEGFAFLRSFDFHRSHFASRPTPSEFRTCEERVDLSEGASLIAYAFRRQLMDEAIELLASKDDDRLDEVLRLLAMVVEYSTQAELVGEETGNQLEVSSGMDSLQHWWANVASVAALWQQERWDQSRNRHTLVDSLPRGLKARAKPRDSGGGGGGLTLAQAVQTAYRVQRRAIFGPAEVTRPCGHNALKMADEAGSFLETSSVAREEKEKQFWLWSALACDWLLSARVSLNQPPHLVEGLDEGGQIGLFERDLATLQACLRRAGLSGSEAFRRWSVLHQARLRLWCGCHPVRTSLALRRSQKEEEEEEEAGGEVGRLHEWLHQRLMRARPTGALNGLK